MKFIALLAAAALAPTLASADETFRCGNYIVNSSMTVHELTTKCGEPAARDSNTQDVLVRNRNTGLMEKVGETTVETWTFDRGNHAADMVVTIVDGRIKSIDRKK